MTLDEAISRLHTVKNLCEYGNNPDDASAVQLGIEALAFIKGYRRGDAVDSIMLLPGETKE